MLNVFVSNTFLCLGKKCTYGKKCKFFHPECARPVSERMKENSERRLRASNESIELAVELMKANNVHNSSLSGTARDKMVGVKYQLIAFDRLLKLLLLTVQSSAFDTLWFKPTARQ